MKVDKLTAFDGDVELGNRKGKLITIYDCSITLSWTGEAADGTSASGSIVFPEVSHENEDNNEDYLFQTEMSSPMNASTQRLYQAVRTSLAPSLKSVFREFRPQLIETNAKDLGHDADAQSAAPSSGGAPAAAAPADASQGRGTKSAPTKVATSTSEIRVAAQLAISAADLWDLLTNSARIPMWSKAPAQMILSPGAHFSLFGGNITGTIEEVNAPKKLVQKWRVPQWSEGHFGKLTTTLTQGDDSTQLEFVLSHVPKGEEDSSEAGLQAYYIRGLKSVGYVTPI